MRKERDYIGELEIPDDVLYGIHSLRAKNNFPDNTRFDPEWYKAMGLVKLAVYETYRNFKKATLKHYPDAKISFIDDAKINALIAAAGEVAQGKHFEHFIVPAVQGGAGTSINMNVNEIIANLALLKLGYKPGEYDVIDPVEHANIYQSTNDTVPTALRIALMKLLLELEEAINKTRRQFELLEEKHRYDLRLGYTQLQQAVPATFGNLFGAYAEALGRDWWRISKCFERIKFVNLGGSAIGTSISVPRYMIVEVVPVLRRLTNLPLAQAENLYEATQNQDALVEISGILKAHAANLEKITNDLRLLSSELVGRKELELPQVQVGSSIMPSKINPVIPEFVISIAHKVYANDQLVTTLVGQGQLELNAYLPVTGHALLENIRLLLAANDTIVRNLLPGLKVNTQNALENLYKSPSIATALNPVIGYHNASRLAKIMRQKNIDIFDANKELGLLDEKRLKQLLEPSNLLRKGWSVKENNKG